MLAARLTVVGKALYDEWVGICGPASCRSPGRHGRKTVVAFTLLPVRSTVGQLPLEQHIGVRIPDGQPKLQILTQLISTHVDVSRPESTYLVHYNQ